MRRFCVRNFGGLFRWLKAKKVTAIITGEKGDQHLTRHGLEEYVSDCVIFLDHRVINQVATRRLRVIKYRGSRHGTNEYPTLIDETRPVGYAHQLSWPDLSGQFREDFDRY